MLERRRPRANSIVTRDRRESCKEAAVLKVIQVVDSQSGEVVITVPTVGFSGARTRVPSCGTWEARTRPDLRDGIATMERMVWIYVVDSHSPRVESRSTKKTDFSQVQFLIKWWMQQVPNEVRRCNKTIEAPRMWYMNTIVDMLEMKRQVRTTQTNRRRKRWKRARFHSLNGCKEANDDLDAPITTVCDVVLLSRSRCASQHGERDLGDDPARPHSSGKQRSGCVREWWCRLHEQGSCGHAEGERLVESAERVLVQLHSSRRTNSGRLHSNLRIIIGEIRWSTTSLVTDRRCQRKGAEEDERVSLRSVRPASTSTIPHLNTGTEAWNQRECQEQAHRPEHQVTSTQTEELAIHPSELRASRREEDVQAVCLRHHKWEQGELARARV